MVGRVVLGFLLLVLLPVSAASANGGPFVQEGFDHSFAVAVPAHVSLAGRAEAPAGPVPRDPTTVPFWESDFQYGGQSWGSLMVGTNPAAGSVTTIVPVEIVPLRLTFARDGAVQDFPGMAQELAASSLFTPLPFISGTTQLADAYRRGDFWQQVTTTSPGYHTLLGGPTILPTQQWTVPAAKGFTFVDAGAQRRFGIADSDWFSHQLKQAIVALQIDPRTLVVFLAYNTDFTYMSSPDDCFTAGCHLFAGVHGALINGNAHLGAQPPQSVNTYAYASFLDPGQLVPPFLNEHLYPVSHEILEWLDDPLAFNLNNSDSIAFGRTASSVPGWTSPFSGLGCPLSAYEVADPLTNVAIGVPGSSGRVDLFADAVFQPWFARTASTSINGLYDMGGVFQTYSDPC